MASTLRARARPIGDDGRRQTVEWNETAAMAAERMRAAAAESLVVVADGRPIGRVSRRDIERCERHGNWLDAVLVLDLVAERCDTCN